MPGVESVTLPVRFGSAGTTKTPKRKGRPDAEADAVSIITMHSAKGLEWPIVIPINSTTIPWSDMSFLYRRQDDSVHFKIFGFPSLDYETVRQEENEELRRERIRLWYVAVTRARDLLLLPQTKRTHWKRLAQPDKHRHRGSSSFRWRTFWRRADGWRWWQSQRSRCRDMGARGGGHRCQPAADIVASAEPS